MIWLSLLLIPIAAFALWYAIVLVRGFVKAGKRHPAEQFAVESTTPYGALRLYQRAVELHDIEAMVAAKDFKDEAEVMLRGLDQPPDDDLVSQTAETLEAAFRAQWKEAGWPDLSGTQSFFSEALPLSDNTVFVHHQLVYPDGAQDTSQVRLVRRGAYWRVSHAPI